VDDIYKNINDTLLDGMPCDRASVVVLQDEKELIWKRNLCVHEDYWSSVGGDIKNYYLLRDEFIKGLLQKANVTYDKLDELTSKIRRM
jgi:ADP-ribose pyrophosphatase YjhB (NUDIX family)